MSSFIVSNYYWKKPCEGLEPSQGCIDDRLLDRKYREVRRKRNKKGAVTRAFDYPFSVIH